MTSWRSIPITVFSHPTLSLAASPSATRLPTSNCQVSSRWMSQCTVNSVGLSSQSWLHSQQRRTFQPIVAPPNLDRMAASIRERSAAVLDNLPRNETFDWVDRVSIELTTQMLAVLFDFPWEDRQKLTRWSDLATALPKSMLYESEEQRLAELGECVDYFRR